MPRPVRAYHLILTTYGFWLPNDPRGSYSDFVRAWELLEFGVASKVDTHRSVANRPHDKELRYEAKRAMSRKPVRFNGAQALTVSKGFRSYIEKSQLIVWACCILPDHAHLVIARHNYSIEQIANLLKGSGTTELLRAGTHPFQNDRYTNGTAPSPWSRRYWSRYLGTDKEINRAIKYVENNPMKMDFPRQHWRFVLPFKGSRA